MVWQRRTSLWIFQWWPLLLLIVPVHFTVKWLTERQSSRSALFDITNPPSLPNFDARGLNASRKARRGRSSIAQNSQHGASGAPASVIGDHTASPLPEIVIDPDSPLLSNNKAFESYNDVWKTSYEKGIRLWRELQDALHALRSDAWPNLEETWTRQRSYHSFTYVFREQCSENQLLAILDETYNRRRPYFSDNICVKTNYEYSTLFTRRGLPADFKDEFYYSNWFSTKSRIIAAAANHGRINPNRWPYNPHAPSAAGSAIPTSEWLIAPHRWSEVVFAEWIDVCRRTSKDPAILKFVTQMNINNPVTREVVNEAVRLEPRAQPWSRHLYLDYDNHNPDFYALVGSPNGFGVAGLLMKFAGQFATRGSFGQVMKVKTIRTVGLSFKDNYPFAAEVNIAFVLEDVSP